MIRTKARQCTGKIPHPDRGSALAHVARLAFAGAAWWRLAAYRCRTCRRWHVGHNPPPRTRRRPA